MNGILEIYKNYLDVEVKILKDKDSIISAQRLAYEGLVLERGHFDKNGYARNKNFRLDIKMIQDDHGDYFVDEFDENAVYFGLYKSGEIIICARVFKKRKLDNKHLAQLYFNNDLSQYVDENTVELGRLSIKREYRNSYYFNVGLLFIMNYLVSEGLNAMTFTKVPKLIKMWAQFKWTQDEKLILGQDNFFHLTTEKAKETARILEKILFDMFPKF